MNKKIKSVKEIQSEIESIFVNSKNESALTKNIKSYLKNVTGKEIISKNSIEDIFFNEIWMQDYENGTNLRNSKKLNKIFPKLNHFEEIQIKLNSPIVNLHSLESPNLPNVDQLLAIEIALFSKQFKSLRENESNIPDIIGIVGKENSHYIRLCNFFFDDYDAALLLKDYVDSSKQKFFLGLIINKIIPLNAVLIYFDRKKDISENTQDLYLLLNKHFPRITIQSVIHDNLDNIRNGKLSQYLN